MLKRDKKIAVIGGGFSGLATLVMLQEEGFHNLICFEKTDQIGGTWCYRENSVIGVGSIMPTTILNHSKEMGAFSNFPPRKEVSNYMKHNELYQYMQDNVAKNDGMKYVRLNHQVTSCKRAADYEETGRWSVTVRDTVTGIEFTEVYDSVVMCVGYNNHPKMPTFPGLGDFKGKVMHSHSLKWASEFKGQNVVVIGMGCSALDAAVEISSVAKQVYLSTKSGAHVMSRVGQGGYPIDYILLRRYLTTLLDIFPAWFCSWIFRKLWLDPTFDYRHYPVEPKYHIFAKVPAANDHIFSKLLSGQVIQKRNVSRFTKEGVIFESENEETKVDSVIMATGYEWKFPFLEEGIVVQEEDSQINLYKFIFPPHLKHPTFAVMGFFLTWGPGFPPGELQCRYIGQIFSGNGKLPSEDAMMKDIKNRHKVNSSIYAPSKLNGIRAHVTQYCDEIATLIGAKPNFLKMFFFDFWLWWKLIFGPFVSYQYRLEGPHKWAGARDAIMTVEERLHFPLQKDRRQKQTSWWQMAEGVISWLGRLIGMSKKVEKNC